MYKFFFKIIYATELSKIKQPTINSYFSTKLFNLIREKLYLVPFWSGLMIEITKNYHPCELKYITTRLTNNIVENSFGFKKNQLLEKRPKPLMPSAMLTIFYNEIKATFIKNYLNVYLMDYVYLEKEPKEKEPVEKFRPEKIRLICFLIQIVRVNRLYSLKGYTFKDNKIIIWFITF